MLIRQSSISFTCMPRMDVTAPYEQSAGAGVKPSRLSFAENLVLFFDAAFECRTCTCSSSSSPKLSEIYARIRANCFAVVETGSTLELLLVDDPRFLRSSMGSVHHKGMAALHTAALCVGLSIMVALASFVHMVEPALAQQRGHTGMADLPPLLEFANGTAVTTMEDWQERREEMKALLSRYYYG